VTKSLPSSNKVVEFVDEVIVGVAIVAIVVLVRVRRPTFF
jgi:hypothetical protein